jgi:hypothetical protein
MVHPCNTLQASRLLLLLLLLLQVNPLKLLSKAPRGSTAKAFHGIRASSKLVYADQVQVRC